MKYHPVLRRTLLVALAATVFVWLAAAALNPAAITITTPDKLKWTTSPSGSSNAILFGDPSKPGPYGVLTKWSPNHMSRPHTHPNDRHIYVISGTWWVGTGPKYDPSTTTPVPAGSSVLHNGKQIHWDGAKDGEVVLYITGMGPADSTNAEQK